MSPIPRVVPLKRPRVAVPLVRRVRSLPVKVLACSAAVHPSNGNRNRPATAARGTELQAIKSELTQIKTNIEALLVRLEQISATDLMKAEESQSEEAWQDEEETSSGPEEEEEQRQSRRAEEEEEDEEHRQDESQNRGENRSLSPEMDSVHP